MGAPMPEMEPVENATAEALLDSLKTIAAAGNPQANAAAVLRCVRDYEVDAFVVGLPLNMDGTEGPQAKAIRGFGDALAKASGKPVHYWDERLSSFAAEELLQQEELTRRKKRSRVDRVAALVILQEFLAHRLNGQRGESEPQGE